MNEGQYPRTRLSMLVFGIYLIIVGGIGFGIFPHQTLSLIGMKAGDGTFIRMVGLLAFILGINYLLMVDQCAVVFFKLSTIMRYFAGLFMIILVWTGISPANLLILAFGDLGAATWTLSALRIDSEDERKSKKQ